MDGTKRLDRALPIWVVYDNPRDYPGFFIARKRTVEAGKDVPTNEVLKAKSLEEIRERIHEVMPNGFMIPRDETDDPVIVECWL